MNHKAHNYAQVAKNETFKKLNSRTNSMLEEKPPLKELYANFAGNRFCRYRENFPYPVLEDEKLVQLTARELFVVGRFDSPKEFLTIAYFGNAFPIRIVYLGEDISAMRKTVSALELPRIIPQNIGEKVFHILRGHLTYDTRRGEGWQGWEIKVKPGGEAGFKSVLEKLISAYGINPERCSDQEKIEGGADMHHAR